MLGYGCNGHEGLSATVQPVVVKIIVEGQGQSYGYGIGYG